MTNTEYKMKKFKVCRHPDMSMFLAMNEEDDHISRLMDVADFECDLSLAVVTIEEHPSNWLETLPEFES